MARLPEGFYTALGTPLDENGGVIRESLQKQIETQIAAKASGLLLLGSMGMQCAVKNAECRKAAEWAVGANKGRVPVLCGVMDNSVARVMDRIDAVTGLALDGVVLTTPFYFVSEEDTLIKFFRSAADRSPFPIYLYDLPGVTKMKITEKIVGAVSRHPNIRGIKTPDPVLARNLILSETLKDDFSVLFSNLDIFDVIYKFGVARNLDGMFDCTPRCAHKAYAHFARGEFDEGAQYLAKIVALRDTMARWRIFPSFTALMNLLGYRGFYHPDYYDSVSDEANEALRAKLAEIGEI